MGLEQLSHDVEGPKQWTLWREDIYGNQYRMSLELADEADAVAAQQEYTVKGHHQTYFIKEMNPGDATNFIAADSK